MKKIWLVLLALCVVATATAQDFAFEAGLALGTDVIFNQYGNPEVWNSFAFQPDFSIGNFGIGLDLMMHFQLAAPDGSGFKIFPGDWIPDYENSGKTFLDIYLPKFMYIRYGHKGDPLYAKLGSIDDFSLGTGFIMSNYSNTKFLPGQRIFGLQLNMDAELFDFPYLGAELLTANLSRFDVTGGRFFVRPLAWLDMPILPGLQLGGTVVVDRNPELWALMDPSSEYESQNLAPVSVFGMDMILPIISGQVFPLAVYTDVAFQPEKRNGIMLGAAGRLVSIIAYGAELRFLSPGFIPVYFDANYDIFRAQKAALMASSPDGESFAGWLFKTGVHLMDDKLFFDIVLDGPFARIPEDPQPNPSLYPHLRLSAGLGEGLLGGFFFNLAWDKYNLGRDDELFKSIIDPTDAVITAALNYRSGAAVFTLLYNLVWDPQKEDFTVSSSLQSSIRF